MFEPQQQLTMKLLIFKQMKMTNLKYFLIGADWFLMNE